jgi:predicted secreted protein
MASRLSIFLAELRRRKVYRVAAAYAAVGFAVASGAQYVFEILGFPLSAARIVAILVVVGFPVAVIIAWIFEITPEGIRKTEAIPTWETMRKAPATWVLLRMAIGTTVLTGAFVGAYFLVRATLEAGRKPLALVVLPPSNQTGDPSFDDLGEFVVARLSYDLQWAQEDLPGLSLVDYATIAAFAPDPTGSEDGR